MPLPASMNPLTPRVVPGTAEKTFDKVRIANLRLNALDPNGPAKLRAELVYYREVDESTVEDHTDRVSFRIDNLHQTAQFVPARIDPVLSAIAATSPEEAMGIAVAAMQAAVEKYAKAKEVI